MFFFVGGYIYSVLTTYQTLRFLYTISVNPLWEIIPSFIHSFNKCLLSANQERGTENIMMKKIDIVGPNLTKLSLVQCRVLGQM